MECTVNSIDYQNIIIPFLREYDVLLHYILSEFSRFRMGLKEVKKEAVGLIASNRRLHRGLRQQVERNLSSSQDYSNVLLTDLQSRLDAMREEKDVTLKMLQTTLQEVDRLEVLVDEKKDYIDRNAYQQTISKMKADHLKKQKELSFELEKTKNELFEARKNLQNAIRREARYSEPVRSIERELESKEKLLDEALQNLQATQERLISLEDDHAKAVARLSQSEAQLEALNEKSSRHLQEAEQCHKRSQALQVQLNSALEHSRESISVAEKALLEKEHALLHLSQAEAEVKDLKASLDCIVEEASEHTVAEVDKVRQKSNKFIKDLISQVGTLEQALTKQGSVLAHQAEENSLLEAEVEGLQNALAQLRSNRDPAFQKITTALALADKSCQEQRLQVESLRDELSQQARKHTLESRHRELENQRLSKALEDAETNLNKLVASQIVLEDAAIKARQRLKASEAESTALGRKLETEVAKMREALRQQQADHNMKTKRIEERCENKLMEMQALLEAQKTMNERWKVETLKITAEFQEEVSAMRKKVSSLKRENRELKGKTMFALKEKHKERKRGGAFSSKYKDMEQKSSARQRISPTVLQDSSVPLIEAAHSTT